MQEQLRMEQQALAAAQASISVLEGRLTEADRAAADLGASHQSDADAALAELSQLQSQLSQMQVQEQALCSQLQAATATAEQGAADLAASRKVFQEQLGEEQQRLEGRLAMAHAEARLLADGAEAAHQQAVQAAAQAACELCSAQAECTQLQQQLSTAAAGKAELEDALAAARSLAACAMQEQARLEVRVTSPACLG